MINSFSKRENEQNQSIRKTFSHKKLEYFTLSNARCNLRYIVKSYVTILDGLSPQKNNYNPLTEILGPWTLKKANTQFWGPLTQGQ